MERHFPTLEWIFDHYPRVEYLFGCFFQRYLAVAQVNPQRVLSLFVRRGRAVPETIEQLARLIGELERSSDSEDSAQEFLESLDCPYYPPFYGRLALGWLRQAHRVLLSEHLGLPAEAPAPDTVIANLGWYQPLNSFQWMEVPELPLLLPNILLGSYLPLYGYLPLVDVPAVLGPVTAELVVHDSRLADVVPLSANINPLRMVSR